MVKVWLQEGGKLELISLHSSSSTEGLDLPRLVMLQYNSHYYLQPLDQLTTAVPPASSVEREKLSTYSLGPPLKGVVLSHPVADLMLYDDKCTPTPYGM